MVTLKTKKYQVVWQVPINITHKPRQPAEIFESEETQELKNLVTCKYIKEV